MYVLNYTPGTVTCMHVLDMPYFHHYQAKSIINYYCIAVVLGIMIKSSQELEFVPKALWACVNHSANVTCTDCLLGTVQILSTKYIGINGRALAVSSSDEPGYQQCSNIDPHACVFLTNKQPRGNGQQCLTIDLCFIVKDGEQNQSITCKTSNNQAKESFIQLIGKLILMPSENVLC